MTGRQPIGWRVSIPEQKDPERPILHPAQVSILYAKDGWTESGASRFAHENGGKVLARVYAEVASD